jgi:hypothetical protein
VVATALALLRESPGGVSRSRNLPHLDDHRGDVIDLGMVVGEGADRVVEVGHDPRGGIPSVDADDVDGPSEAEAATVRGAGLDDPVGEKKVAGIRPRRSRRGASPSWAFPGASRKWSSIVCKNARAWCHGMGLGSAGSSTPGGWKEGAGSCSTLPEIIANLLGSLGEEGWFLPSAGAAYP